MCRHLYGRDSEVVLLVWSGAWYSSDTLWPRIWPESSGPHSEDLRVSSRWPPGAGGLCTATTTRICARGREENQHHVVLVLVLFFAPLNSVSPVLCFERELRPLVHFDGELLMICQMDGIKQVTLSHCFYINHVCVCWKQFLDIKHLVVNLFTMAFLRICVSWGRWKMDSRTA